MDKHPIGSLTEEDVATDPKIGTVTSFVNRSYQMLSNTFNLLGEWDWTAGTVFRPDIILQDMAAGDMQKKWNPDGDQAWMDQFSTFSFTADNGGFNGQWSYDYEGIARINKAVAYLTDTQLMTRLGMDETLRKRMLGEVLFLRAYYYFELVNYFGDVPLILKPIANFQEAYEVSKRQPAATVWEQINKDLADAKGLLPNTKYADNTDKWRVSKGAVIALQAKAALYNQKWDDVLTFITELETLGFYHLNANYFDNFNVAKEYADDEVIFSYNHTASQVPSNGNCVCAVMGWGFIAPTANFISTFETNDPRLLYTIDVTAQASYKILGETTTGNKGNEQSPSNKVLIRYADVLLWKAEAYNEKTNPSAAIGLVNQVRLRARTTPRVTGGTAPAGTLPDRNIATTDKALVKDWIMQERRVELGFESQRFNDLRRWKTAKQVLTALGRNFQDKHYLYPVPQGEIDKSGGSMPQNKDYDN
jgi:hypothetical protein